MGRGIFDRKIVELLELGEEKSYNNSPGYVLKEQVSTFTSISWFSSKMLSR